MPMKVETRMGIIESKMEYNLRTYLQGATIKFDINDAMNPTRTIPMAVIIFSLSFLPTSMSKNAFRMLRATRHAKLKKYINRLC